MTGPTENDPMDLPRNSFKHAIAAGKLQIGLWCSLCSNIAADILRDSGFDWLLLDSEHSPNDVPGLLSQLQAVDGGGTPPPPSRYGRVENYLKRADAEICLLVQVETGAALNHLEAIASVDGI